MMEWQGFKTEPFAHQREGWEQTRNARYFAFPVDMGLGKSKMMLDTAAWLWSQGEINALVIVAPNGVHRQWIVEQVPEHLPDWVPYRAAYYGSYLKAAEKKAWEAALQFDDSRLNILAFHYEGVAVARGKDTLWKSLQRSRAMLVLDESHRIKTPSAKVTQALQAAGRRAFYRRILSGTPYTQSPLDAYSQFKFLHPNIIGENTYAGFKAKYSVENQHCSRCHEELTVPGPCPSCRHDQRYGRVVGSQNLAELRRRLAPVCYRVRKQDCPDLPPKVYETRSVPLSPEQRRIYSELLEEGVALLHTPRKAGEREEDYLWRVWQGDDRVEAETALSQMARCQQVLGGFAVTTEGAIERLPCPRLRVLDEVLEEAGEQKVIIWARFREEIALIAERHPEAVQYHGGIDATARGEAIERFTRGDARIFLGTAAAGGTGLNLTAATMMVYYSNSFNAAHCWQSEDRAHRIGQTQSVTYVDLIADNTLDAKILANLRDKRKMADYLLDGDLSEEAA
jgi:SNF2 family DNA or RNA helicase